MSKKVISLALAVVMLFSMASMASAALGEGKRIGFTVSASSTTVEPGATVEIIVSAQAAAGDLSWGSAALPLAYDKDLISEPVVAGGSLVKGEANYSSFLTFKADGFNNIVDTSNTNVAPKDYASFTERAEDAGNGWDSLALVNVIANGKRHTFTEGVADELFRYTFTVSESAQNGDKIVVGIPVGSFDGDPPMGMFYSEAYGMEYWVDYDGEVYDFTDATVELTVGSAAPSVVVTHEGTQSKWANGTPVAADYLFGFLAKIDGIGELATTKDDATGKTIVNDIASITATATINGVTKTDDVQSIWVDGTGYKFRAQFADFTPDMTDEVSVTFVITMTDGTTVYETADAATATINGIYLKSVSNGLAELA